MDNFERIFQMETSYKNYMTRLAQLLLMNEEKRSFKTAEDTYSKSRHTRSNSFVVKALMYLYKTFAYFST